MHDVELQHVKYIYILLLQFFNEKRKEKMIKIYLLHNVNFILVYRDVQEPRQP